MHVNAFIAPSPCISNIMEETDDAMGFLHNTVTRYKIRHAGWQKNAAASKTKRFPPAKRDFPLFWMSQCVACHPAGEILYHLTASCKGPITWPKLSDFAGYVIQNMCLFVFILNR